MTALFEEHLTVCIDAANLSGFLALAPTLALIEASGVAVGWLPLTTGLDRLSARQPGLAADDPLAAYKARRAAAREAWAKRELERDCERLGISVELGERHFDARCAGMGLMFLNARGGDVPGYLERVYQCAYVDGKNVSTIATIATLLGDADFEAYVESGGYEELESLQRRLLDSGVFSSPAYVVNGEVFQGRQHLPLLGSLLAA